MKRILLYVALGLAAMAAAYGAGRYTAPSKVETKEKVVTQVKTVVEEHRVEGPVRIVTRTVERPAPETPPPPGCPECPPIHETTTTEERGPTTVDTHATVDKTKEISKSILTEREYPRLTIGAGVGSLIVRDPLNIGVAGMTNYRVAGPFGVWASGTLRGRDSVVLAGVSITF